MTRAVASRQCLGRVDSRRIGIATGAIAALGRHKLAQENGQPVGKIGSCDKRHDDLVDLLLHYRPGMQADEAHPGRCPQADRRKAGDGFACPSRAPSTWTGD